MKDFRTFLLERGIIDPVVLEQLWWSESESGGPLYYRLLQKKPELEEQLWGALAEFLGVELVDPQSVQPHPELARLVPVRLAHQHTIVPISRNGRTLEIALADPHQFEQCDEFAMLLARRPEGRDEAGEPLTVVGRLARPSDVAELIKLVYGIGADTVEDALDSQGEAVLAVVGREVVDLTKEEASGEDAAIIRFVNQILMEAVKIGASDIHVEPYEQSLAVRYRLDGVLQEEPVPDRLKHLEAAIISRIKIMAGMDIAEKRLPQDGQIRLKVMGRHIDVRVSVLPTMFGQGVALRLLDRQVVFRSLDNLGMPEDYLRLYREVLQLSHGVILVTGPTGSGKTTTLYASLNELNRATNKIITVEDPIEYQLEGVTQIQVKPRIDLTFANLLRSILRHDPDIIMVGEIRDRSTAEIAISAAMTGHLVFSTLHTNDAPSAAIRLLEMGVEAYLVSSALEAVVAQRLVRRVCEKCREAVALSEGLAGEDRAFLAGATVYEAAGCVNCHQSGYQGRSAIFEMFTLNDRIREMIIQRTDAKQIRAEALRLGMRTLRQSGLEKVKTGVTTLAEVYRVARDEMIDMRSWLGRE